MIFNLKLLTADIVLMFVLLLFKVPTALGSTPDQDNEYLVNRLKSSNGPLILADTNHYDTRIRDIVSSKLSWLKNLDPNFDCLFLEEDRRMQSALETYRQNGDYDFEPVRKRKIEIIKKNLGGQYRKGMEKHSAVTADLLKQAQKVGIRVFAADLDFSNSMGRRSYQTQSQLDESTDTRYQEQTAKITLHYRNQAFAKFMESKASVCSRSIVLIGALHIYDRFYNFPVVSLQKNLEQLGYEPIIGSIQSYSCVEPTTGTAHKRLYCLQLQKISKELNSVVGEANPAEFTWAGD